MPHKFNELFLIILLLSLASSNQQPTFKDEYLNITKVQKEVEIDPKRLQQINFVINSYFSNCSLQSQFNDECFIKRQNYAQFLYSLFHKEHIMNFLKLYQLESKLQTDKQIGEMYKIGQKVQELVISGYRDWIEVYKPNSQISLQQMYGDIPELDRDVLDVIQHNQSKHQDFINVLRKIKKIQTSAVRYIVMGNKSEEQIANDYASMLEVYFGSCQPVIECKISIPAFVYFVKELAFYITPLVEEQSNKETILVGADMDFRATEFLIDEIEKMRLILGAQVQYSQLEQYSQLIATNLFQYLKSNSSQNEQATGQQQDPLNFSSYGQPNQKQQL